jgi:flagellar biosynthetic protein FliR
MIINLAFGVMSRAAPQLNIISVGFPMMTLIGIGVLLVTISGLETHYTLLFEGAFGLAKDLMERL